MMTGTSKPYARRAFCLTPESLKHAIIELDSIRKELRKIAAARAVCLTKRLTAEPGSAL